MVGISGFLFKQIHVCFETVCLSSPNDLSVRNSELPSPALTVVKGMHYPRLCPLCHDNCFCKENIGKKMIVLGLAYLFKYNEHTMPNLVQQECKQTDVRNSSIV